MTIFQRKDSATFRHGHAPQCGTQRNPTAVIADALPQVGQCGITAAPWEGRNLEAADAEDNTAGSNGDLITDLERFLASVPHGE